MAKAILRRHLHITEEPRAVLVTLQKDCIPQYMVGHCDRMSQLHQDLVKEYNGRWRVAGSSYCGVGVNDCIRSAYETVRDLVAQRGLTGLESFLPENDFQQYPISR